MTWHEIRARMISDFGGTPLEGDDAVCIVHEGQLITVTRVRWGSPRVVELIEFTLMVTSADQVDAAEALVRNGEMAFGGFVERAGVIWWRYATPVETLDVLEAQLPLAIANGMAAQAASHGVTSLITHQNTALMWH